MKKILTILIISLLTIFLFGNESKSIDDNNFMITYIIDGNFENDYITVFIKYNTIFLPMDDVLEKIFNNYKKNSNQTIQYENSQIEINVDANIIHFPNVFENDTVKYDNSVEVEIEVFNNIKYIPIYLISNIDGIEVKIDNKSIYDSSKYLNSIDAINTDFTSHTITIENNKENINEDTTYIGQEQGALWREEALKRIEKYRKQETKIIIKNKQNEILDKASLDITMENNEFKFGTAIRYYEWVNPKFNNYDQITKEFFNTIGSENMFKWKFFNTDYGKEFAKDITNFSKNNNMSVRGHCLWWDHLEDTEIQEIIGNKENPEEGTMAYVYEEYSNMRISKEQAQKMISNIKNKFENIVLNHIEEEMKMFSEVTEWDVVNEPMFQKYFKHYLYDEKFLEDNSFLTNTKFLDSTNYDNNEEFNQFLAKCFEKAHTTNPDAELVLNETVLYANMKSTASLNADNFLNNILKYTNNIDKLGIQYHLSNSYRHTPQAYYNHINSILAKTSIKKVAITEYDNYVTGTTYTEQQKKVKADYLRDAIIMAYSNKNIDEFVFWVYNSPSAFTDEERNAYKDTVYDWLNYNEKNIEYNSDTDIVRNLHKGIYKVNIKYENNNEEVTFQVSDDTKEILLTINNNNVEHNSNNDSEKTENTQNSQTTDTTTVKTLLPNAGENKIIMLVATIIFLSLDGIFYIKIKKYKDVK